MIRFVVSNWVHRFLKEYIDSLVYVLKDASVHIYDPEVDFKNIMLLDGVHVFVQTPYYTTNKHIYVINTEQTILPRIKEEITRNAIALKRGLCDYGANNISVMKRYLPYPVDIHYLPYQFNPTEIRGFEKTMNTVFLVGGGWNPGERRRVIADKIPDITILGGEPANHTWGEDRDDVLFRHKVLVNVHTYPDWSTHEVIRTFRCVFNKMIVVTERSDDDDTNPLRNHMIIVDYEDIPKTVENVLANYSDYYNRLFETPEFESAKEALKLPILEFKKTVGF